METIDLLLVLIPLLPLASAVLCAVLGPRLQPAAPAFPALLTAAAIGAALVCSLLLIGELGAARDGRESFEHVTTLWTWAQVEEAGVAVDGQRPDLNISISLRADALTVMMLAMVTFIAALVAVFAWGYMRGDPGNWRFFSYVSLFVFSMTMLVSVSNFLLLFVFWEAVGLCSYLLIGFWYQKPEAAAAGKKAFLVNRVGDFGFALALFLIWITYGTLNYHDTLDNAAGAVVHFDAGAAAAESLPDGVTSGVLGQSRTEYTAGGVGLAICLLLLLGACGKSAQLPLHVWLPDAMEGPTPVSALIHAATMVTAGVYMIARCSPLFMASPEAQLVVSIVGAATALVAGVIALTQFDLKRVLAFSTVSQLGYMFLALGAGTFAGITAAMFHLFTHAFFKALLFLGSGSVMHAMGHTIDMRQFSGLRRVMPVTHWTFLIGCLALSGMWPLAGFWSKDSVVASVHERAHELMHGHEAEGGGHGGEGRGGEGRGGEGRGGGGGHAHGGAAFAAPAGAVWAVDRAAHAAGGADGDYARGRTYQWLYWIAMVAAVLTPFYTFRAYAMTFHGPLVVPSSAHTAHESPPAMTAPLIVLAACAVVVGFWWRQFPEFLRSTPSLASPSVAATYAPAEFHLDVAGISLALSALGIGLALYLYLGDRRQITAIAGFMSFEWADRVANVESLARLKQSPWIRNTLRDFEKLRLGWLARGLGLAVLLTGWVLAAPLMLVRFCSPRKLSENKFYFDELYDFFIVAPLRLGARVVYAVDRWLIDGLVNTIGQLPPLLGRLPRSLQNGLVQYYALAMVVGLLALFFARLLMAG